MGPYKHSAHNFSSHGAIHSVVFQYVRMWVTWGWGVYMINVSQ
uniref:Uncharacterized protein n=1 Tax=Anguilla anguilla TaxID=7936 RepID=A0A0E9TYX2_ANGAN